jgi:hypothetical protein
MYPAEAYARLRSPSFRSFAPVILGRPVDILDIRATRTTCALKGALAIELPGPVLRAYRAA